MLKEDKAAKTIFLNPVLLARSWGCREQNCRQQVFI